MDEEWGFTMGGGFLETRYEKLFIFGYLLALMGLFWLWLDRSYSIYITGFSFLIITFIIVLMEFSVGKELLNHFSYLIRQ